MRNTRTKKLPLDRKECETVFSWYMFVETPQRTSIDNKFATKLEKNIKVLSKKAHDSFLVSAVEAQVVGRWFLMIPMKIRDNLDTKIYKALERFIDKN